MEWTTSDSRAVRDHRIVRDEQRSAVWIDLFNRAVRRLSELWAFLGVDALLFRGLAGVVGTRGVWNIDYDRTRVQAIQRRIGQPIPTFVRDDCQPSVAREDYSHRDDTHLCGTGSYDGERRKDMACQTGSK